VYGPVLTQMLAESECIPEVMRMTGPHKLVILSIASVSICSPVYVYKVLDYFKCTSDNMKYSSTSIV
jgi:hypothetical protein